MAKTVLFGIIGVVVGIVIGMIFMMSPHLASTVVHPLPEGVDLMPQDPANHARFEDRFRSPPP